MAGETLGQVIRRLGRSGGLQGDLTQTDSQLLERFARQRDEPAFAALVARHGPMVLGVCRRLLHDSQDAEDAFQAVFLVLARKAPAVRRQLLIGPWLYGVAWRVAVRLRGQTARRREREQSSVDLSSVPADDAAWTDVRWVVHEEVQHLPDVYRSTVVLCFLEGKTNEEAARLLRRPVGTVKSRLTRARELLRTRLIRRGMGLAGGGLATALAAPAAPASAALAKTTIRAAIPFASGEAVVDSARVVALSQGVLQTMLLTKVKITAALALAVVLFSAVGGLAYRAWAGEPGQTAQAVARSVDKPAPPDQPAAAAPKETEDAAAIQGNWVAVSAEVDGKEAPPEAIKDFLLVITADKLVFNPKGENRSSTYRLDPAKTPKVIEITPQDGPAKGQTAQGLYELDGDRLKLCLQNGDGKEPTAFATTAGSGLRLLVLNRQPADKPKDDQEAIQGAWRVVALETEGMKRDDDQTRQIKTQKWVFTANKLVIKTDVPGAGPQEAESAYKLDPEQTPKAIDIIPNYGPDELKDKTKKAIYGLDGDILKICHSMTAPEIKNWDQLLGRRPRSFELRDLLAPGRPAELATKEGSQTTLLTLEREPAEKDKPKKEKPEGDNKATDKAKYDKAAIQGTWEVIGIEKAGRQLMDNPDWKQSWAPKWVFSGDQVRYRGAEETPDQMVAYRLDPSKTPKEMDSIIIAPGYAKDTIIPELYSLDGDILKICLPPDKVRPTELAARRVNQNVLVTLRRASAAASVGEKSDDSPHQPGKAGGQEAKLLQDWRDAAGEAFRLRKETYTQDRPGDVGSLIAAAQRLLEADLEQSATKADRVAVYQAHLQRVKDFTKAVNAKSDAGRSAPADAADGEAYLLRAEFLLEREKAK